MILKTLEGRYGMNVTFLDADTREVVCSEDYPQSPYNIAEVMKFVSKMKASIVRTVPHEEPGEWTVELKIPVRVRRTHTPLPGDTIHFRVNVGNREHWIQGVYQFKRRNSYVIQDDSGGAWKIQSMREMKKPKINFPNMED